MRNGTPAAQIRRRLVMERFVARVFAEPDSGWVLKGGAGLLLRLPNARYSKDIDLYYAENTLEAALQELAVAAGRDIDGFRFDLTNRQPLKGVDGVTVSVTARIGVRTFDRFTIDLSTHLNPVTPDEHQPTPIIDHPNLAVPTVLLYPIAEHVADKVCAMYYRQYGGAAPSSRYRDLVDLVLIVDQYPIDQPRTTAAIAVEARRRAMTLPSAMVPPGPQWPRGYREEAQRTGLISAELQLLDVALDHVGSVLGPMPQH